MGVQVVIVRGNLDHDFGQVVFDSPVHESVHVHARIIDCNGLALQHVRVRWLDCGLAFTRGRRCLDDAALDSHGDPGVVLLSR